MSQDGLIGHVVDGRFRIECSIGRGSVGNVYLSEHIHTGRQSAIKVLLPEFAVDEEIAGRFRREALVSSGLDHSNIVRVENFGELEDGRLFLAMEYARGPSLRDVIRSQPKPPLYRVLSILMQLCDAVHYAHEAGVVHRDLKPDNLVLMPRKGRLVRDHVKVLDFGLAKMLHSSEIAALTLEGQVFGTPAYMSPEQCRGQQADFRTDVYSFGVIAYELVAGRLPFMAKRSVDYMIQHAQTIPADPATYRDDRPLPEELCSTILRCLAKQPAERWQQIGALRQPLEALFNAERETAEQVSGLVDATAFHGDASTVHLPLSGNRRPAPQEHDSELDARDPSWVLVRYCQIVRTLAARLARQVDDFTVLVAALSSASEAENALLREETDIAFLEAEIDSVVERTQSQMTTLNESLIDLNTIRAAIVRHSSPAEDHLDEVERQLMELERQRVSLEMQRESETADIEGRIDDRLVALPALQRAHVTQHLNLGELIADRNPADLDTGLQALHAECLRYRKAVVRNDSAPGSIPQ